MASEKPEQLSRTNATTASLDTWLRLQRAKMAQLAAVAPATISRWELEQSFGLTKKLLQAMLMMGLDPVEVFELEGVAELPDGKSAPFPDNFELIDRQLRQYIDRNK